MMTTLFKLTDRQVEILRFAAEGLAYKQIAHQMDISYRTVTTQVDFSIRKNKCKNCVELVYKLSKAGIL